MYSTICRFYFSPLLLSYQRYFSNYYHSENVGLLGLTRIGSRRVVQISTAFMFFFSIFGLFALPFGVVIYFFEKFVVTISCLIISCYVFKGKFGAFFASIPLPIYAAIYCVLFGIVGEWCWRLHEGPIQNSFFPFHFFNEFIYVSFFWTAASGISFIQFANCNSMRNLYVLGLSLFLGISIPQYFVMNATPNGNGPVRTDAGWVRYHFSLTR